LAPEERGEVLRERRPVVRRCHAHDGAHGPGAALDVDSGGEEGSGAEKEPRVERSGGVADDAHHATALLEQPGDGLGGERGAPGEGATMLPTPPRCSSSRWMDSARSAARRGSDDDGSVRTTRISPSRPQAGPTPP